MEDECYSLLKGLEHAALCTLLGMTWAEMNNDQRTLANILTIRHLAKWEDTPRIADSYYSKLVKNG